MRDVGEEETLGVASIATQPDALGMCMHRMQCPRGGLQDQSDPLGSPCSLCRALGSGKPFFSLGLTLCQCERMERSTPLTP